MDILQIDSFRDSGMDVNVLTAVDTGELRPEGFCAGHGFSEADIFGAGRQSLR